MKGSQGAVVALLAGALMTGAGCFAYYGPEPQYAPQPAVIVGPGPIAPGPGVVPAPVPAPMPMPGMRRAPQLLGVGLGLGSVTMADELAGGGILFGLHANLHLARFLGVEAGFGVGQVSDESVYMSGDVGDFTVMPLYVNAFFDVPDGRIPNVSYKLGAGTGQMIIDHNLVALDKDSFPFFLLLFGTDVRFGPHGKLFVEFDFFFGEDVLDITNSYLWESSVMMDVRLGVEFGF